MRYAVQYLIPLLIVASLVYLVTRGRYSGGELSEAAKDQRTFLVIFCIGAVVAAILGFLFYQYMMP
ncbi:MAG: hypothetical protein ACR2PZ_18255 [Pseudomonadales bacterium]